MSHQPHTHTLSAAELQLRDGPIGPLFRKYAIPGVITLLFVGLQTIIDGIVLGNFAGANALASVSLVLPCYSLMSAIAIVVGIGCQTIISISLGEQNRPGANDALRSAFVFLLAFSVVGSLAAYIFAPNIAAALGANEVLLNGSVDYFRALVPFFPLIVGMFFSDYVIKSMGRPVYSMAVMSSCVILNIILDLLFICVLDMGTFGAGLATGLAFTVGAAFNLPMLFRRSAIVSLRHGHFRWRLLGQMIYNGSSEGISELSAGISTLLFNLAMMKYLGESGVAAFTALNYIYFIGVIIFLGVSDGIIPIVSYNYGANQWQRIRSVVGLAAKSNLVIGVTIFSFLALLGEQVTSLFFRSGETQVLQIAAHGSSIYALAFLINGFNILAASYFTAMANAKMSIIISLLRGLIFVWAGIYFLPLMFGIEGIWYAVPLAELCTLAISGWLVRRSLRIHKSLTTI